MKKHFSFILVIGMVILCLVLPACGVTGTTEASSSGSRIKTMKMRISESYQIHLGRNYKSWVTTDTTLFKEDGEIEFFSTNPEVATIKGGTKAGKSLWFEATTLSAGETIIYAQTIDGSVKSDEVVLTVLK